MKASLFALLLSLGISASGSAALIAAWDVANSNPSNSVPVWDWDDHVTVSNMDTHGDVTRTSSGTAFNYQGFSASINPDDYIGFSITPDDGYQMTLTDLVFNQKGSSGVPYEWAYRIAGGAWQSLGEFTYDGTKVNKTIVFGSPITTTEEVEFGFFAATPTAATQLVLAANASDNDLQVNGSVNVATVPEPSLTLLGAAAVLGAACRRRRL